MLRSKIFSLKKASTSHQRCINPHQSIYMLAVHWTLADKSNLKVTKGNYLQFVESDSCPIFGELVAYGTGSPT